MFAVAGGILLALFALYVLAWLVGHSGSGGYVMTREERRKWDAENPEPLSFRIMSWIVLGMLGYGVVMAVAEHIGFFLR